MNLPVLDELSNDVNLMQQSYNIEMERAKDVEWEGFEHFQEPPSQTLTSLANTAPPERIQPLHNLPARIPKERSAKITHKPNPRPAKLESSTLARLSLPAEIQGGPVRQVEEERQKERGRGRAEVRIEARVQTRRYERVPIVKYEQECRYAGKVVFKGFVPRTSDNYMRLLKEVDWEHYSQKKRDIRNLHGIEFNSQFESGNLNLAIEVPTMYTRVSELEYDLYLKVDSNTRGHRQWFYFSMKNEKPCTVKLHLYRFKKVYSLFQRGMRPYFRSRKHSNSWQPAGKHLKYHYEKAPACLGSNKPSRAFVLSFSFTFQTANDEVFVASGIPYSYSYLNSQLALFKQLALQHQSLVCEVSTLTRSVCGLDLPLVTAYHPMARLLQRAPKRFIVINARTHSGQTSGSWVLDGLLRELVGSKEVHEWMLSENVEFKIVPMLNPDGVVIGNYRTGILGEDFNRKFNTPRHDCYPEILALKRLVAQCKREGRVELFLDLHGHSVLKNSFIYGPAEGEMAHFRMKNLAYHLFHNSKYFRLGSCRFNSQKNGPETARLFFQQQEEVLSFTCENSLGLYYTQHQTIQMVASDWQSFGQAILRSMRDIYNRDVVLPPPPSSLVPQVQSKTGQGVESQKQSPSKTGKQEKIFFKLPSAERKPSSIKDQSQHGFREDEPLELEKQESKGHEEQSPSKMDIDLGPKQRRKSEIVTSSTRTAQRILRKDKAPESGQSQKQSRQQGGGGLERSLTTDPNSLLKEIANIQEKEDESPGELSRYELEAVRQNFSEEYSSINDLDSSSQDLPDQEKNYVLEYAKLNQRQPEDVVPPETRTFKSKSRDFREPRISRFREIRFRSIQQASQEGEQHRESCRNQIRKLKLEPHKFKDATTKTLMSKYNETLGEGEFDDPGLVSISQQKRLNKRISFCRRTQKDPFVLVNRKEHPSRRQ